MESSVIQNPPVDNTVQEVTLPLFQTKGWIRFLAVMSIIQAVIIISSTMGIGMVYAWLPIWIGVILFQAANAMEAAYKSGDKLSLLTANSKLKTYFIIQGVTALLSILFGAIVLLTVGMAGILGAFANL
jgi:hypothetical protein